MIVLQMCVQIPCWPVRGAFGWIMAPLKSSTHRGRILALLWAPAWWIQSSRIKLDIVQQCVIYCIWGQGWWRGGGAGQNLQRYQHCLVVPGRQLRIAKYLHPINSGLFSLLKVADVRPVHLMDANAFHGLLANRAREAAWKSGCSSCSVHTCLALAPFFGFNVGREPRSLFFDV